MPEKINVPNDINLPSGVSSLHRSLTGRLTFENGGQLGQGQFRIFHHQARFLLQTFFDPFSDHRLIMFLAFQLRYRFQDADQMFRQSNCFWRMAFGMRHLFVKICGLHPLIFRLNPLLLCFGQFAESLLHRFLSFSLTLRFQVPASENAGQAIAFVLEDQPQAPASVRYPIQNVNIIEAPFIAAKVIIMKEAFFGFFRLDPVIAQMLNVAVLFVRIVLFKFVPTGLRRHRALLRVQSLAMRLYTLFKFGNQCAA